MLDDNAVGRVLPDRCVGGADKVDDQGRLRPRCPKGYARAGAADRGVFQVSVSQEVAEYRRAQLSGKNRKCRRLVPQVKCEKAGRTERRSRTEALNGCRELAKKEVE